MVDAEKLGAQRRTRFRMRIFTVDNVYYVYYKNQPTDDDRLLSSTQT